MTHFTLKTRKSLADLLHHGTTYREIGFIINFAISSISQEITLNGGRSNYCPLAAEKRAQQIKHRQVRKRKKLDISPVLKQYVVQKLKEDWSQSK